MKGILMSPGMATAVRERRKTMTRRIMKPQPDQAGYVHPGVFKMPYKKGDIFYVREEHYAYGWWQPNGFTKTGRKKFKFVYTDDPAMQAIYVAETLTDAIRIKPNSFRAPGWYKRLGRFMPRKLARTFLKVIDMRAELLLDISQEDAVAEGIEMDIMGKGTKEPTRVYRLYVHPLGIHWTSDAILSFKSLWEKINGKESLQANLWVWVICFELTGKPI